MFCVLLPLTSTGSHPSLLTLTTLTELFPSFFTTTTPLVEVRHTSGGGGVGAGGGGVGAQRAARPLSQVFVFGGGSQRAEGRQGGRGRTEQTALLPSLKKTHTHQQIQYITLVL